MRRFLGSVVLAAALFACIQSIHAQSPLEQAVEAKFPLTKATADHTDIVTAGSVMVLKKDGLLMYAIDSKVKSQLVYKDGRIQASTVTKLSSFSIMGHTGANVVNRTYVAGEKFWLIGVQTLPDGMVLQFLSDPVSDVRYAASLKFPFPKGAPLAPDKLVEEISQVIEPEGNAGAPVSTATAAAAPAAAPAAPMAPIAPPPPPPDQAAAPPPTLSKGQTRDQVVASFGQPVRVVKMGAKEIDYYKDMKVTFTNNKVSNVE